MNPPPRHVHRKPCQLELCPLQDDLVMLQRAQMRKAEIEEHGSRVDSKVSSRMAKTEESSHGLEIISGTDTDTGEREDSEHGHGSTDSDELRVEHRPSDTSSARPDPGEIFESAHLGAVSKSTIGQESASHSGVEPSTPGSHVPVSNNMDYVDMSGVASPQPASEFGDEPVLSLSHSGTLGKRPRSQSPSTGHLAKRSNRDSKRKKLGRHVKI